MSASVFNVKRGVTLAEKYNKRNPVGMFMSEKLNGIRAIWTGKNIKSRTNKIIHAPQWFLKQLPSNTPLNGELYLNKGKFESISSIVSKKQPIDSEWKQILFMIFNKPTLSKQSFENRYNNLKKIQKSICRNNPNCPFKLVKQTKIKDSNNLQHVFEKIIKSGGEGVMLKNPNSTYSLKRTKNLLKMKPFSNAEGIIYNMIEGKGKDKGKMGALKITFGNKKLKIGSGFTNNQRVKFWKHKNKLIGNKITFKYEGLTKYNIPRFPTFLRMRFDKNI